MYVYTALEAKGARAVIRTGGDLQAGPHLQAMMAGGTDALADQGKGTKE